MLASWDCSLCGYIWPSHTPGGIRSGQSWQHGTHGLATWAFALGSANILRQTPGWGSCTFSGVWGLLPHPLLVPCQQRSSARSLFLQPAHPHLSCHLLWAVISALLCSRTWLGRLELPFLLRLIFQQMSPGKKPENVDQKENFPMTWSQQYCSWKCILIKKNPHHLQLLLSLLKQNT